MDSVGHVVVPLRVGGKKMKKRRELDALVAHSLAKRACNSAKRQAGNGVTSQDQLLSQSTDEQEDSTWSKVPITTRNCRSKRYSCLRTCGPLVFLLSIFMLFGFMYWLYFDLRQQIYDHRIKIEQVSASSHLWPDALQKWHESTKSLQQNQTEINKKISDIQLRMEYFEKELSQIKDTVNKKDVNSETEKLSVLQNNVANFGAKIKDLSIDVDQLKEHYHNVQQSELENKINITKIMTKLDSIACNSSSSSIINSNNETLTNMVKNLSKTFTNELKNLSVKLILINDTLSQKAKGLDDDIHLQKPKLDGLVENFANMSSHVTSIEDDWTKYKQKAIDFEENSMKLNTEIFYLKNNTNQLANSLNDLQIENRRTINITREMQANMLKDNKQQNKVAYPVTEQRLTSMLPPISQTPSPTTILAKLINISSNDQFKTLNKNDVNNNNNSKDNILVDNMQTTTTASLSTLLKIPTN